MNVMLGMNVRLGDTMATTSLTSVNAVVEQTIQRLLSEKYTAPDWVRQGPSYARNTVTGVTVNLYQEASALIDAAKAESGASHFIVSDPKSLSPVIQPVIRSAPAEDLTDGEMTPPVAKAGGKVLPYVLAAAALLFMVK